ncbi:MAG: hypothetical protein HQK54_02090 [Oligoflexales bacterium]|nr:hypothetical protein [Oligoflexales bacterium]
MIEFEKEINTAKMKDEEIDNCDQLPEEIKSLAKRLNGLSEEDKKLLSNIEVIFLAHIVECSEWLISLESSLMDFWPINDIENAAGIDEGGNLLFREYTSLNEYDESHCLVKYDELERMREKVIFGCLKYFGVNPSYCKHFTTSLFELFDYIRCNLSPEYKKAVSEWVDNV